MRKILIIILLFLINGCVKTNSEPNTYQTTKSIVPTYFTNIISSYQSYNPNLLNQYYLHYLDSESLIYSLNVVNYPDFLLAKGKVNQALWFEDLVLVNRKYALDQTYSPNNLIAVHNVPYIKRIHEKMLLDEKAFLAYQEMVTDAEKLGINFVIYSGYRSWNKQNSLWKYQNHTSNSYLALPGHSEHQTGLAIDIGTYRFGLTYDFCKTAAYNYLSKNAYLYGFILRYPLDKVAITGYEFEPWHYRYVGEEIATIIFINNWTLEEYIYNTYELNITTSKN